MDEQSYYREVQVNLDDQSFSLLKIEDGEVTSAQGVLPWTSTAGWSLLLEFVWHFAQEKLDRHPSWDWTEIRMEQFEEWGAWDLSLIFVKNHSHRREYAADQIPLFQAVKNNIWDAWANFLEEERNWFRHTGDLDADLKAIRLAKAERRNYLESTNYYGRFQGGIWVNVQNGKRKVFKKLENGSLKLVREVTMRKGSDYKFEYEDVDD
jgi:hypothetical protein